MAGSSNPTRGCQGPPGGRFGCRHRGVSQLPIPISHHSGAVWGLWGRGAMGLHTRRRDQKTRMRVSIPVTWLYLYTTTKGKPQTTFFSSCSSSSYSFPTFSGSTIWRDEIGTAGMTVEREGSQGTSGPVDLSSLPTPRTYKVQLMIHIMHTVIAESDRRLRWWVTGEQDEPPRVSMLPIAS